LTKHASKGNIVLPFQLERPNVRGRFTRLDSVIENILEQHNYPSIVEALITEATILTVLIGQMVKLNWRLSLQIRGDGPIRLIATDFYGPSEEGLPAQIRAYASYDKEKIDINSDPFTQIGTGYFAVIINQGKNMSPYQGITPLSGGSLSSSAEAYFFQSEQIPTKFCIAYGTTQLPLEKLSLRAGGIMLQHMPNASPLIKQKPSPQSEDLLKEINPLDEGLKENWARVGILLDTIEDLELIGPSLSFEQVLYRLFHDEIIQTSNSQNVNFGCTCSEDKVRQSMSIYSTKDLKHMTKADGSLTADCQFCGAHYILDPTTLGFEVPNSELS
jgi:molecular chaperone Hsp33